MSFRNVIKVIATIASVLSLLLALTFFVDGFLSYGWSSISLQSVIFFSPLYLVPLLNLYLIFTEKN